MMPSAGKRTVNCKSFNFLIVTKIMLSNLKKYQLILASNSPRRKELMSGLGVEYVVRTLPDVDESYPETLVGAAIPEYISREKADAYRSMMKPGELLITADTIVWLEGKVLGRSGGNAACSFREVASGFHRCLSNDNRMAEKLHGSFRCAV